jgi:hypothetical protein
MARSAKVPMWATLRQVASAARYVGMPAYFDRLPDWSARHPWIWGLLFGLFVGGGVIVLSTLKFGLRASSVILGVVIFVAFGLLGIVGGVFRRFTPGGPT